MSTETDTLVRERAYHIWEAEGRRDGWALDHWMRARREIAGDAPATPAEATAPAPAKTRKAPAKRKAKSA